MSAASSIPVAPAGPVPGFDLPLAVRACDPVAFDRTIAGFDDALPEQTACFAASHWRSRIVEHRLLMSGERVAAAATVVVVPLFGSGVAAVKWGPLWRAGKQPPDPADYRDAIAALQRDYAERRGLLLSVMPPADPVWGSSFAPALAAFGFQPGAQDPYPERYFIDLRPNEPAIRSGFSSKWRYNLNKSQAAGFTTRVLEGRDGIEAFMPLYGMMLQRKRFHDDSPVGALPALFSGAAAFAPVTVLVEDMGVAVAGAVIARAGDTARYLFGASSDDGLDRKPGYFMQWEVIRWLKSNTRCAWYALGGTDGSSGLAQFKKGMVGRGGIVCAEPAAYDFAATRRAMATGRLLYRMRSARVEAAAALARLRARVRR